MSEPPFHDPTLKDTESRLLASKPRLAPDEEQRMLYQCAFAAGQARARRALRGWQATTAVMGLLLVSLAVPVVQGTRMAKVDRVETLHIPESMPVQQSLPPEPLVAFGTRVEVELDAWQLPPETLLREQLAYSKSDLERESLSVGQLYRSVLERSGTF